MCLVDIFHMSPHISFGAKDLFALGTFNIGMDIHVLFHLLVIYERSCISFGCAFHTHPQTRLRFVFSCVVIDKVGFGQIHNSEHLQKAVFETFYL